MLQRLNNLFAMMAGACALACAIADGTAQAATQAITIDAVDVNGTVVGDAVCDIANQLGTWRVVTPAVAQITPGGEWLKVKCAKGAALAGASTSIGAAAFAPRRVDAMPGALRALAAAPAAKVRVVMRDPSGAVPASPARQEHQIVQTAPVVPPFLAKMPAAAETPAQAVASVTAPRPAPAPSAVPPAARVTDVHDVNAVPHLSAAGREAYFHFLRYPLPRAFAISKNGGWGFGVRGSDPRQMALDNCERRGGPCEIYVLNQQVMLAATDAR